MTSGGPSHGSGRDTDVIVKIAPQIFGRIAHYTFERRLRNQENSTTLDCSSTNDELFCSEPMRFPRETFGDNRKNTPRRVAHLNVGDVCMEKNAYQRTSCTFATDR